MAIPCRCATPVGVSRDGIVTVGDERRDLTQDFINDEYLSFPVSVNDDMLDSAARIFDIPTQFPNNWGGGDLDYSAWDRAVV